VSNIGRGVAVGDILTWSGTDWLPRSYITFGSGAASTGSIRVGTTWSLYGLESGADKRLIDWNGGLTLGNITDWTDIQFAESSTFTVRSGGQSYITCQAGKTTLTGALANSHTNVDSTPYTVLATDRECAVKTNIARTCNLEALATAGDSREIIISDRIGTAATNPITIHTSGVEKINGVAADVTINWNWGSMTLKADTSEGSWRIIGSA
jgi:hypothetical protein